MPRYHSSRSWALLTLLAVMVLASGCTEMVGSAVVSGVMDYVSGSVSSSLTGLLPLDEIIIGFATDNPFRFW